MTVTSSLPSQRLDLRKAFDVQLSYIPTHCKQFGELEYEQRFDLEMTYEPHILDQLVFPGI